MKKKTPTPYGCDEKDVANYTCYRIDKSVEINGDLSKPVWERCNKSSRFVDMVTGEPGIYDTRGLQLAFLNYDIPECFSKVHFSTDLYK